ncbi:hypothetical protein WISP_117627 [Willisornis vidua]|uniref:Uncharacterized protein n=1 Tax=Willisornis vidua TaxID=1566151 RepID=A0ABQ9CTK7_9PASS|nr:hypothetical protein WISP_117627 [Willisornis vidua]
MIRGLEHFSSEDKAEGAGVVQLREEKAPERPNGVFQYLKGPYKKQGEECFIQADSDRKRGNGFKLQNGRLRLDVRKKFFTVRVVKHWTSLPREAVNAPSLEVFKARLDEALSNLI